MSDQKFLYNDTPYKKEHEAKIIGRSAEFGIKLDEPIFYPKGGGQPGDSGLLLVNSHHIKVIETVKDPEGQVYVKIANDNAITELSSSNLNATVTTVNAHGLTVDDQILITGVGSTDLYNGTYRVTGITSDRKFSYNLNADEP